MKWDELPANLASVYTRKLITTSCKAFEELLHLCRVALKL